ncbi:hypothetical protein THASP1DRAFT_31910 [Thamnocephalis sphaerospora]|uniref:SigF-like NTF2-like domain-containing protein n=1 Tax=Thamnocephalis sphaerospora TaxID=78915 RepID=A0A4P9XKE4_9FUNG|nr:hypothetical protein THASP1DRAFT_31910 [Thamnocephalis sphaerospora]|eukprot:RKP06274.1 hypothetical protein THASP1DRAFT_31910 [Thamnocephalis sphaerospora]
MKRAHLRDELKSTFQSLGGDDAKRIAEAVHHAYTEDAVLEHPLMVCKGLENIIKADRTWTSIFHDESSIEEVLVDGNGAVVKMRHHIRPRLLPMVQIPMCIVSELELRETTHGCFRIARQVDHVAMSETVAEWPVVGYLLNSYLRPAAFYGWATLGRVIDSGNHVASNLSKQAVEQRARRSSALLQGIAAPYIDWAKHHIGLAQNDMAHQEENPTPAEQASMRQERREQAVH